VQTTGFAPVQTPAWHVSAWVHALPSLQLVPFATLENAVAVLVGWHDWQALEGFAAPGA
jgi:hypothetical protein